MSNREYPLGKLIALTIISHSICPHCDSENAHNLEDPMTLSKTLRCPICDEFYKIEYSVEYIGEKGKVKLDQSGAIMGWNEK